MKLVSWNVNGVRAIMQKGFMDFFTAVDADVLCLQEIKIHNDDIPADLKQIGALQGYTSYWNGAKKKGYSGTATFTRLKVESVSKGIGDVRFDDEGRILTLEFKKFYVVNVYVPNAKDDLSRLEERQEFDALLLKFLQKLDKVKPVFVCGDMNVAHEEIDLARPKENVGSHGFTNEERKGMSNFITAGFIDIFREQHLGEKNHYTWWSYFGGARSRNVGWRIDYFLVSKRFAKSVISSDILHKVHGSDHCPVSVDVLE